MSVAPPKPTTRQAGQAGEDAALDYLTKQGLTLVERNFRCKQGEIDLIMRERDTLVFVEVRKRANDKFGGAAASITHLKQARLITAAQIYLQSCQRIPACRFDAVTIEGHKVIWLQNIIEN